MPRPLHASRSPWQSPAGPVWLLILTLGLGLNVLARPQAQGGPWLEYADPAAAGFDAAKIEAALALADSIDQGPSSPFIAGRCSRRSAPSNATSWHTRSARAWPARSTASPSPTSGSRWMRPSRTLASTTSPRSRRPRSRHAYATSSRPGRACITAPRTRRANRTPPGRPEAASARHVLVLQQLGFQRPRDDLPARDRHDRLPGVRRADRETPRHGGLLGGERVPRLRTGPFADAGPHLQDLGPRPGALRAAVSAGGSVERPADRARGRGSARASRRYRISATARATATCGGHRRRDRSARNTRG